MLFNSLQFYIFFPVVVAGYFLLPYRFRWAWLLMASCVFYMAFIPAYILVLAATIVVDYFAALYIARSLGRRRAALLWFAIALNIAFLAFFKYYGFAAVNLNALADFIGWNYHIPLLAILLPLGLSFHMFQGLSYLIEVYRRKQAVEHHFGIFSLYVMFFPQLVAGPIERPQHLLPQFYRQHAFSAVRATEGLGIMARGFFKKIVIADNAALMVNVVFTNPGEYHGIPLMLAAVLFSIQLYCDFSGYSDIARGAARVMGFELMLNFDRPYLAQSLSEFWKRWHISLSSWFRDYLFLPLAYGSKNLSVWWLYVSLIITFSISGLWHGANWTFIAWGFLHGACMALSLITRRTRRLLVQALRLERYPTLLRLLRIGITMGIVTALLVFFRAASIQDAWYMFSNMSRGLLLQLSSPAILRADMEGIYVGGLFIVVASIGLYWLFTRGMTMMSRNAWPSAFGWGAWYVFLSWLLYFGAFSQQTFIYFQF